MSVNKRTRAVLSLLILYVWVPTTVLAQTSTNAAPTNTPPPELKVRAGLRMELVAGGNLVESPAAMAFDERGRLFVAELRDYPAASRGNGLRGRVRLLEDSDQDGIFDTSIVYADDLTQPSAIACSRGGVFVAGVDELVYLLDLDDDGIADLRRTQLTFRTSPQPGDPNQILRSMRWGPDRRIHLTIPQSQSGVVNPNVPAQFPLNIPGGGLSFNPLTMELRAESSPGATGLTFDEAGRVYFCSPSILFALGVLTESEVRRNPFKPELPTFQSLVPAPSGATPTDCLVYQGNSYSTNLHGQAFLADPVNGVLSMLSLRDGKRLPEAVAQQGKFLVPLATSEDRSFRPIRLAVGPDDTIYVADLARAVYPGGAPAIDDPEEGSPRPSGRIWKLIPNGRPLEIREPGWPTNITLLASTLSSSNSWTRATVARLLYERHSTNAAPALHALFDWAKQPMVRLEALRSLDAIDTATPRNLSHAMGDKDPMIRLAAARMTESRVRDGRITSSLWASLRTLSADRSPEIRRQAALSLGAVHYPSPRILLRAIYTSDPDDVWINRAMLTTNPRSLAGLFIELIGQSSVLESPDGRRLLQHLATGIGLEQRNGDVSDCLRAMLDLNLDLEILFPLVTALSEGVQGGGSRLPTVDADGYWARIANAALNVAIGGGDVELRAAATRTLAACIGPEFVVDEYLLLMFAPGLPEPVQIPVIQALAAQGLDRDYEALTQRWHLWGAPEQLATLNVLLERGAGEDALLRALADDQIPINALTSVHINLLRSSPRDDIRARADRLFGREQPNRTKVLSDFLNTLDLSGSPTIGRELFTAQCSFCHQADDTGLAPAPGQMSRESSLQLLAGLLDPSREIASGHTTTILRLKDGRTVWGVMDETDDEVIHLRTDRGMRLYLKGAVDTFGRADWSLMPDNIASGLDRQDIADLLAYLKVPPP